MLVNAQSTKGSSIFSSICLCSGEILRAFKTFRTLVGRDDEARCFCSFLVVLACENDTSNFPLFSPLPPCNAIFRFHVVGFRVEIDNCIFLSDLYNTLDAQCQWESPQSRVPNWRLSRHLYLHCKKQPPVSCHQMHKKKITWKLTAAGGGADCS